MAKITALVHARNDAGRIARTLDSLAACDEVLVIDHGSTDETAEVYRAHGATVKAAIAGVEPGVYAMDAANDWVLCLRPGEKLSPASQAGLARWKQTEHGENAVAFRIELEDENGTASSPAEARLVNRARVNWPDELPTLPATESVSAA